MTLFPTVSDERRLEMFSDRPGPARVLIDTDTANEVDDQFAIAWALLSPDRIEIEAIVAEPFGHLHMREELVAELEALRAGTTTGAVENKYEGGEITTTIGRFRAPRSAVAGGDAVLSIRPEAVTLGADGGNSVMGRIRSHVYVGRYARFRVTLGDIEVEAITDPGQVKQFNDGDEVPVRFDSNKIWVIGPASSQR